MEQKREPFYTVGQIALRLGVPLHRVRYAIETRSIEPIGIAGNFRLFGGDNVAEIAEALNEMSAYRPRRVTLSG